MWSQSTFWKICLAWSYRPMLCFRSMAFLWTRATPLPHTTPECTQCTRCCMKPGRECGISESHRQRSTHIFVRLDCEEGSFTETLWFVTQPHTSCAVCVFWDVMTCSLAGTSCLLHATWCHIPEDGSLYGITVVLCVCCCLTHLWSRRAPLVRFKIESSNFLVTLWSVSAPQTC